MTNLVIYCCSAHNLKILDKLPPYIKPLALGDNVFPEHWLNEKKGENISNLNKYCKITKRCKTMSFVYPMPRISKPRVTSSNLVGRANKSFIY